ncbi:hypothetical protein K0M31_013353 [Melipona bicolor]|uniref:Uncharacterized protein n=1 Tax=Melipona bicolor TaxID=60889 RepID=A0AA40FI59_9HYME|nr:hypothetical protein K0M31_013353 [Melipona bicolor]
MGSRLRRSEELIAIVNRSEDVQILVCCLFSPARDENSNKNERIETFLVSSSRTVARVSFEVVNAIVSHNGGNFLAQREPDIYLVKSYERRGKQSIEDCWRGEKVGKRTLYANGSEKGLGPGSYGLSSDKVRRVCQLGFYRCFSSPTVQPGFLLFPTSGLLFFVSFLASADEIAGELDELCAPVEIEPRRDPSTTANFLLPPPSPISSRQLAYSRAGNYARSPRTTKREFLRF